MKPVAGSKNAPEDAPKDARDVPNPEDDHRVVSYLLSLLGAETSAAVANIRGVSVFQARAIAVAALARGDVMAAVREAEQCPSVETMDDAAAVLEYAMTSLGEETRARTWIASFLTLTDGSPTARAVAAKAMRRADVRRAVLIFRERYHAGGERHGEVLEEFAEAEEFLQEGWQDGQEPVEFCAHPRCPDIDAVIEISQGSRG